MFSLELNKFLYKCYTSAERKLAKLKPKTLNLSEGRVHYLEGGRGKTIVLLHGFGANKDNWNKLARHLTNHFHVIAIDLPGFGDSFKLDILNYTVIRQVDRIKEIVDNLGVFNFVLCGNSYGGYIASNFAANYPNSVTKLVLLNPLGIDNAKQSNVFEAICGGNSNALIPKSKKDFLYPLKRCFYQMPYIPNFAISALYTEAICKLKLKEKLFEQSHLISGNRIVFERPINKIIHDISCPIDLIWGTDDQILSIDGGYQLKNIKPAINFHIMTKTGHLPMIENPKFVASKLIAS